MRRGLPLVLLVAVLGVGCATVPVPAPTPAPAPPDAERTPVPERPAPPPVAEEEVEPPMPPEFKPEVEPRLIPILADLGITYEILVTKRLRAIPEAHELVVAQTDPDGRRHELTPSAAAAYHRMREAAQAEGVEFSIVSAYRSVARQIEIVRRKRDRGESIDEILAVSPPPGFSEHHSGNVVDLKTPGSRVLAVDFADTSAYRWLVTNAHRFGFVLSYPENNPEGYMYEPWHWRFDGTDAKVTTHR